MGIIIIALVAIAIIAAIWHFMGKKKSGNKPNRAVKPFLGNKIN
jgi:hypothetical protein